MLNKRTTQIIDFLKEIEKFKLVERIPYLSDKKRREDDAGHSWHLAMMVMALENELTVKFNLCKAMKLALIHDLGEIYIGDDWYITQEQKDWKKEHEIEAVKKVFSFLPTDMAKEYFDYWTEYEEGITVEARVVKALDKISYQLQYSTAQKIEWEKKTSIHESREYARPHLEFNEQMVDIMESLLKEVPEYFVPEKKPGKAKTVK